MHRLRFTSDAFDPSNPVLADAVRTGGNPSAPCLVFIDSNVGEAWPDLPVRLKAYVEAHHDVMRLAGPAQFVPGGEQCKNDQQGVQRMLHAIDEAHLCRQSFVIAIGGGAVLDAVGFAASIAHRGIRLIRFPTTTLSQDDSGLGVKNGINAFGKKNYLGVFSAPWAVINDERFLTTLSDRDWSCGFSEAVKVACIKDRAYFDDIVGNADAIRGRDLSAAMPIIKRSAEIHLRHITEGPTGGEPDPFELTSARPLDFGHWSAHKLEQMTNFRIRHGEAVSIGIALDVTYSALVGMLDESEADAVRRCLVRLGLPVFDEAMSYSDTLLQGLAEFREHLGGRMTITLLDAIGHGVDVHEMDESLVRQAIDRLRLSTERTSPVANKPGLSEAPDRAR